MKCPKCEYLGFDRGDRCRNCGYEFSLSPSGSAAIDLELDLELDREVEHLRPSLDLDRIIGAPPADPTEVPDLPLFSSPLIDTAGPASTGVSRGHSARVTPSVTPHPRPRAPLGVRRATPEVPRARLPQPRPDWATEDSLFRDSFEAEAAAVVQPAPARHEREHPLAPPWSRVLAALVDAGLLWTIDVVVVYLTARLCGLAGAEIARLPLVPLVAFLMLLNGGYFVAFTSVGGQSIGKMVLGLKVVTQQGESVPVGRAVLRTLAYLVSALPLGAGFLLGVISADRLALHDRLAQTRVVRPA